MQATLKGFEREESEVSRAEVETFVKNANYVQYLRLRTLKDEQSIDEKHAKSIGE